MRFNDVAAKCVGGAVNLLEINLPCGSTRISSSRGLSWSGLLVESHVAHAQPAEQSFFPTLLIELASGDSVACGERNIGRGQFRHYEKPPGAINVYADGVRPALRPTTTTELTVCAVDWQFIEEVRQENASGKPSQPRQALGFHDPALAGLLRLLEIEAKAKNPSGRLYVDHLAQALVIRLLAGKACDDATPARKWDLPRKSLQRVMERMRADIAGDHDLETLARESGYSRNHFIQIFRSATGATPHQYLLQLRLKQAKSLLSGTSQSVSDIAQSCGFRHQGHFSKSFRHSFGTSPMDFRNHRSF